MAAVRLDPAYRRVEVDEFLDMDFGGAKAELEDGLIYIMAGGNEVHARIAANLLAYFHPKLRGTGCRPYGSNFATRTGERSIRFPDLSIYCNNPSAPGNDRKKLLGDPQVVFEVLSPSTSSYDQKVKLEEYRQLDGTREIVLVDPTDERIRLVRRTPSGGWTDDWLPDRADVLLPSLDLTIPHAEIFARD
ncbi:MULTISPECIES: Uma2 family endonuclease [Sphingomonas]|uniref:Uma2 family endonuclease n=1 Tax=Sphingomonas TaxID=13687 RepID=UPI0024A72ADE|nr:Uma2 family endonuclease [Sphingomonas faeni]